MLVKENGKVFNLKMPKTLKIAYIRGKGLSILANKNIKKNERIIFNQGVAVATYHASDFSIQIAANHFIDAGCCVPDDFINHSCSPNARIDMVERGFFAIKNIKKNEEITFNYNTTEYDMKKWGLDFKCLCGSRHCLKRIKGFKFLTYRQKVKLKPYLTSYLKSLL